MNRFLPAIVVAIAYVPTLAVAACEDVKARIAEGLSAKGVKGFQLEIVPLDAVDARAVVGRCEASNQKIVYSLGSAPRITEQVAVAALPAKPLSKSMPTSPVEPPARNEPAGSATIEPGFRDPLQQGGEGPLMIAIPAGQFTMGSVLVGAYREGPEHRVLVRAFALGQTEVTFDDYDRFAQATNRRLPDDEGQGRGVRPVVNVSWYDANAYAQWLSDQTGFDYRLPSEAEWEYAARAGGKRGTNFTTGECISARDANFSDVPKTTFNSCPASGISLGKAQPVGSYAANAFGLHDMLGNVAELTADCLHLGYEQAPSEGRAWLEWGDGNCNERMLRGGSWQSGQASLRLATRAALGVNDSRGFVGFRLARAAPSKP